MFAYSQRGAISLSMSQAHQAEKIRASKYCKKLAPKLSNVPLPLAKLDKKSVTIRKLLKKPFFKKTTILTLKPLVFPYYTPHILPSIKTLTFDKLDSSSVLFRRQIQTQKAHSQLLAKCKHINTLIISSEFIFSSLGFIRKLRELTHLDINLPDTQIPQVFDMFKHLIRLKHLKLVISKGSGSIQSHQLHKISKFFQSLKNLAKLKLQINSSSISENQSILTELLENLGNSNITEMEIEINLKASQDLVKNPSEGIQRFFGKLDSLGVYEAQDLRGKKNPQILPKCLKLAFVGPAHEEIDIKDYLGFCTSLKDLWIYCATQTIFISENTVVSKELRIFRIRSFISSQKAKIETTINALAGSKLQVFGMILEDLDHILAKKIAKINQTLDPQEMKDFCLQTNIPRGYWATGNNKGEPKKMLSSNSIFQLVQSLAPFKNLERLGLYIGPQDQKFIKHIEYLLDFFPQLRMLDLDLRSIDKGVNNFEHKVPFYFAIEKLPGLDFLRVKLPPSILIENQEGFFEKLACLKNISHLELDSYHLAHIPQESIPKIVSAFNQMKTFYTLKIVHVPNSDLQREFSLMLNTNF